MIPVSCSTRVPQAHPEHPADPRDAPDSLGDEGVPCIPWELIPPWIQGGSKHMSQHDHAGRMLWGGGNQVTLPPPGHGRDPAPGQAAMSRGPSSRRIPLHPCKRQHP